MASEKSVGKLHFEIEILPFFAKIREKLKQGDFFILIDNIVDFEDAYLNSFMFQKDNKHVRFYTTPEIISAAAENSLELERFEKKYEEIELAKNKEYQELIGGLPNEIATSMGVQKDENGRAVSFSLKLGEFLFRAV